MKKCIFLVFILLVTACSKSGTGTADLSRPDHNQAKLVLYRPSAFQMALIYPRIKLNRIESCTVTSGGYVSFLIPPGKAEIEAIIAADPTTSKIDFIAKPEAITYVRLSVSQYAANSRTGAMFGLVGSAINEIASDGLKQSSGAFDIDIVSEEIALKEIGVLQDSSNCTN